jgi:hypothetical protein
MAIKIVFISIFSCDNKKSEIKTKLIAKNNFGLDSICIYTEKKKSFYNIKKYFYIDDIKQEFYYSIKKWNNELYICPPIVDFNRFDTNFCCRYLSTTDTGYVVASIYSNLMKSKLKYLGKEKIYFKNRSIVLNKFYGRDIGVKTYSENYYYYSSEFELMKVDMLDGKNILINEEL